MLALKITDVKDFMNKLLIGEVFDRFSLVEASVTTFNTFTITENFITISLILTQRLLLRRIPQNIPSGMM